MNICYLNYNSSQLLIEDKRVQYVVDKNNFKGYAKTTLRGAKCPYTGKSDKDFLNEGFLVYDSWDKFYYKFLVPYLQSLQGEWKEISEDDYYEMLECLPPTRWREIAEGISCFACSEALTYYLHSFYIKDTSCNGVKYYSALRDIFATDKKILEDFINQIK